MSTTDLPQTFQEFKLSKALHNALDDLQVINATPIQQKAFSVVASGKDMVGIAQTGTGKTYAYLLPILTNLKFSKQINPRVMVIVPTRELVVQVVDEIQKLSKYMTLRVAGVYGGTNINTQKALVCEGQDVIVGTPARIYDLAACRSLQLKSIQKVVIDEVDVMFDLGFRPQLMNLFDILPLQRQNIMFSATMIPEVEDFIDTLFVSPLKVSVAKSGTPLENITQIAYQVENFNTKVNLLTYLLEDKEAFNKVLVFVSQKRIADRLYEQLDERFPNQSAVIHGNKTQNYRLQSIEQFRDGQVRVLIATDLVSRGIDIEDITQVVCLDTPVYPENYMHRIGRTGRNKTKGVSYVFTTYKELDALEAIEDLMGFTLPVTPFPSQVEISDQLIPEEKDKPKETYNPLKKKQISEKGAAFHEKKLKNQKTNQGGKYRRELAKKYKKPKTRGDKTFNSRTKKKRK